MTVTAKNVTLDPTLSAHLGPSFAIAPMGSESPEEAAIGNKRRQRFAAAMHVVGGFALAFGVKTALTLALTTTPPLLMAVIMASTGSALGGLWEARQLAKKEGISFRDAMKSKKANKAAGWSLLGAVTFGVADHFMHVGQHLTDFLSKIELKMPSTPAISFAEAAQPKAGIFHFTSASADLPYGSGPLHTGTISPRLPQFSVAHVPTATEAFAAPAGGVPYMAPTSAPLMSTPYNFAELPSGSRVSMVFPAPAAEVAAAHVVAAPVVPAAPVPAAPVPATPVPVAPVPATPVPAAPVPAAPVSAPAPIQIVSPDPVVPVDASLPAVAASLELPVAAPAKPVLDCIVREQLTSNTPEWPSYMTAGQATAPTTLHPVCKAFKDVVEAGDLLRGTVVAPNADGQLTAFTYEATAIRRQPISDIVPKWVKSIVSQTYGFGSIVR